MDHFQCDHLVGHWVNMIMAIVKETILLATNANCSRLTKSIYAGLSAIIKTNLALSFSSSRGLY